MFIFMLEITLENRDKKIENRKEGYMFQDYMIQWSSWIEIDRWKPYAIAALIVLFFLLLRKIFTKYIFSLLLRASKRTSTNIDTDLLLAFEKPLRTMFIIIGLYFALNYIALPSGVESFVDKLFRSSFILLITWGVFNLTQESSKWFMRLGQKLAVDVDKILLPFLSKIVRITVIVLAGAIVLEVWGYDINGLIAGLGLGGLAFALAAQDTLKNMFGGIVIITEKPFSLGDWIYTPSVEGTVEDITFRSTKIRTFAQALVTVPNSTLANEAITNWTRMGKRRITFYLKVAQKTPREKLSNSVQKIRDMLKNHPDIHQETLFVHFDQFGESSLDIYLYFFTKTTNWGEWLKIKEDCNLRMLAILEEEGVELACPRSSIMLEDNSSKLSF